MLRRITLENFKSFERLDLELKGPVVVLFGPNASGKSNLLDALQLLSRLATVGDVTDAFRWPFRGTALEAVRYGFDREPRLADQNGAPAVFGLSIDFDVDPSAVPFYGSSPAQRSRPVCLRYAVKMSVDHASGLPRVGAEHLALVSKRGNVRQHLWRAEERATSSAGLPALRLVGTTAVWDRPRTVSLDPRRTALGFGGIMPALGDAMQATLRRYRFGSPNPRTAMRERSRLEAVTALDTDGADVAAFLRTLELTHPKQFESLLRALHLLVPAVTSLRVEVTRGGELELWLEQDGHWIPARLVSDGTLRMLALLATVSNPDDMPTLVGWEEPENGLHPRRIAMLAEFLKTQAALGDVTWVVTTHSPILCECLPDEFLYVCSEDEGESRIVPFEEADPVKRSDRIAATLAGDLPRLGSRIRRGDFGG